MTGGGVAMLLGARMDGVDPSPFVAAICLLAGFCLFLAMRSAARRRANRLALVGVVLACGAAVYSHDVVNLPEMVGAVVIGGGFGLLLVRRAAWPTLPLLIRMSHGLTGAAAMAMAAAVACNPGAFGLASSGAAMMVLGGAGAIGGLACLGALRPGRIGDLAMASGPGWAGAMLGLAIGNSALVIGGTLAGMIGLMVVSRGRKMMWGASGGLPPAPGLP